MAKIVSHFYNHPKNQIHKENVISFISSINKSPLFISKSSIRAKLSYKPKEDIG